MSKPFVFVCHTIDIPSLWEVLAKLGKPTLTMERKQVHVSFIPTCKMGEDHVYRSGKAWFLRVSGEGIAIVGHKGKRWELSETGVKRLVTKPGGLY